MKCSICGTYIERDSLCFECKRDEIQRERDQLRIAANEDFQRNLVRDQLASQQKALEKQAVDLDFCEARRLLLEIEMLSLDNLVLAKKRVHAFFDSNLYREHCGKLLDSVVDNAFLLDCWALHELQCMSGHALNVEGVNAALDYYVEFGSPTLKKLYAKLVSLTETCDPAATGLHPDLVEVIKTHPVRCQEKQKREEEEKQRRWEEFLVAYNEMCRLAQAHTPRPISKFGAFRRWWAWNFPLTAAQHQVHDRRRNRIEALIDWVEEGLREFRAEDGQYYATPEMAVMAKLWCESSFDRRLVTLVLIHLLRQQWRDIESAVAAAVDEFEEQAKRRE